MKQNAQGRKNQQNRQNQAACPSPCTAETQAANTPGEEAARVFAHLARNDPRRRRRAQKTLAGVLAKPGAPVPEIFPKWADATAAYDIAANEKLPLSNILDAAAAATLERIRALPSSAPVHPHFCLDTLNGEPLGLHGARVWSRDPEDFGRSRTGKRNRLPLAEKESGRWLDAWTSAEKHKSAERNPANCAPCAAHASSPSSTCSPPFT
ncbi:MAG: hypothetical protein LBD14_02330 [Puniceicoccales bacterium]|jgi:hypothetical protein|nr:hypothetical protein [Puniceicoccales bacterium]